MISGAEPKGERGFQALKDLGIRTIISVDGVRPDAERAQSLGMRYVHLPFGYDGIPHETALALAKAVRELPGPIYLHCHRGKQRGPTAAAAVCVMLGEMDTAAAVAALKKAGTDPHYRGLYATVSSAVRLAPQVLDDFKITFNAVAPIPPLAEAMVGMDGLCTKLEQALKNSWRAVSDEPGQDPCHAALLLREQLYELGRTEETKGKPEEFRSFLQRTEAAAADLEKALRKLKETHEEKSAHEIGAEFTQVENSCLACHAKFRDNLGRK